MFSIVIELLTGRYTATTFNNRDATEWPPHPARLLSALVAAWGDFDEPNPAERSALAWLEVQPPPVLACSGNDAIATRAPVTVFVPDNDPTALSRDIHWSSYATVVDAIARVAVASSGVDVKALAKAQRALEKAHDSARTRAARAARPSGRETASVASAVLEVLPEQRGKQGRSFPTVVPVDPVIWMSWPDAAPDDHLLAVLDGLCARVGRLGHSSTFVSCSIAAGVPPPAAFVPSPDSDRFLRVPAPGLVDALEHLFEGQAGAAHGPLPHADAGYREQGRSVSSVVSRPLLGGDWIVLGLPRPLFAGGPDGLHVSRSLDLTRAVRGALLRHAVEPIPEILSGHGSGERPSAVSQRPHLAVIALADVAHVRSDGSILGVAIVLPAEVTTEERAAVEKAILAWRDAAGNTVSLGGGSGRGLSFMLDAPRLDPAPVAGGPWLDREHERRATLRRANWCRRSAEWATVTPIALDRFPGDLASSRDEVREAAEANARQIVLRACVYAGLQEPESVEIDRVGFLGVVPPTTRRRRGSAFPTYRAGTSGQARLGVHARIRFAVPVPGPVLVGAGRYLGYGLCLPLDQWGRVR